MRALLSSMSLLGALVTLPVFAQPQSVATPDAAPAAEARVAVSFVKPEKFTDATLQNRYKSYERVTKDLSDYLASLGQRYLPANQKLEIEVTDIDLAGRYEPWRNYNPDTRYMLDVTWPSVNLKYRLLEDGHEIAHGEQRVADMNYLRRPVARASADTLRYEKAMLDDWFRGHFDPQSKQAVAARKP